jgi:tetratricopeptide (TPR) repeat protein
MKSAAVERYERILAADPRSRAFVELARALLEEGDAARAADVCLRGLAHHPGSILGRVVLGRALLATGRERSAVSAFEGAAAVEPENPYALNLACEALVERGLAGRAPHLFERAAALQPTGERARQWLELSRRESAELPPLPPEEPDARGSPDPGAPQGSGRPEAAAAPAGAGPESGSGDPGDPRAPANPVARGDAGAPSAAEKKMRSPAARRPSGWLVDGPG